MTLLLGLEEYKARVGDTSLPVDENGQPDDSRIEAALHEATGLIVMHCPFLLDETGDLVQPLPPQFADGLTAVAKDLAAHRLANAVRDSEDARLSYRESIEMLRRINDGEQSLVESPSEQDCMIFDDAGNPVDTPAPGAW